DLADLQAKFGPEVLRLEEQGQLQIVRQAFQIGDRVVAEVNERRSAPVEGFVRKVCWDEEAGRYNYYLVDASGHARSDCFYESELSWVRSFSFEGLPEDGEGLSGMQGLVSD